MEAAELPELGHSTQRSLTVKMHTLHTIDGLQSTGECIPYASSISSMWVLFRDSFLEFPTLLTLHPFLPFKATSEQRCVTKMQGEGNPNPGKGQAISPFLGSMNDVLIPNRRQLYQQHGLHFVALPACRGRRKGDSKICAFNSFQNDSCHLCHCLTT